MPSFSDLLGSLLRTGFTWYGRRRLAQIQGSQTLAGLAAPVEILRDRWGVPHIYAQAAPDLFFAQGFAHAQDRLFQMDLNRRTAKGTLSELFGPLALDTDRAARTFGFARLGAVDWERLVPDVRELVNAYTAGVNAFIQSSAKRLPIEYSLIRAKPKPWEAQDSMALCRLMIWQLSHAWYDEIVRARLIEAVGSERAAELEVLYPRANPVTLPQGIEFNRLSPDGSLSGARGPFLERGLGSDEWAISGARTVTGKPYLCNDMHMVLSIPLLWYVNHLEAGALRVTGESVPGLPLVLCGHNDRLAWGMTLAYIDCEDLFVEQFDPQDASRYRYQDAWAQAEVIDEAIRVKGREQPHVEKVVITRHGPVISDAVGVKGARIAVQSMALRPCPALEGWWKLQGARGWDDFVRAVRLIEAPQLSVAYADVEGNIGYWITGKVPVRAIGPAKVPAEGWTGEHEWTGEIPFEEMPHAFNPQKGFVVNCNNKIVPDDYPYYLGNIWMNGYRVRRLTEIIESCDKLSPVEFRAMQTDVTCLPAQELVGLLAGFTSADPDASLALERLRGWDGRLTPQSVPGAIYEAVRYALVRGLYEPTLGRELTDVVLGKAFNPVLFPDHEYYGNDTPAVLRMLQDPASTWVTQAGGRDALLERALREGVAWLRREYGADPQGWQWGKLHRLVLSHALGIQKPLDKIFNRGPFPVGGDTDTPWQAAMSPGEPYDNRLWAPSMRHIIDLSDLSRSEFVIPVGQSGQLGSPHYDDLIAPYLNGQYLPMLWTREQVEGALEGRLALNPAMREG
jgi:penicillin G amidase